MLRNDQVRWGPDEMMRRIQGSNGLVTQLIGIGFGRGDGRGEPGANGRVWRAVPNNPMARSAWAAAEEGKRERGISSWGRPGGWGWQARAQRPTCACQVRLQVAEPPLQPCLLHPSSHGHRRGVLSGYCCLHCFASLSSLQSRPSRPYPLTSHPSVWQSSSFLQLPGRAGRASRPCTSPVSTAQIHTTHTKDCSTPCLSACLLCHSQPET